jgi:hypothetical protein
MYSLRKAVIAGALSVGMVAAAGSMAAADPTGSKNAQLISATCDGQPTQVVVNSANGQGGGTQNGTQAQFTPAHVIGTNQVFHPTAFDLTFTFNFNGELFTDTNTASRPNQTGTTTCLIPTQPLGPGGTISGTVTGYFT